MTQSAATVPPSRRRGRHVGPLPITPLSVLIAVLLVGSPVVMLYGIAAVKDERQVTFLEAGAIGLTIAFALWALGSLRAMWRAASAARSGRAMAFAIIGGLVGMGAIGSFAMTMILALLWGS